MLGGGILIVAILLFMYFVNVEYARGGNEVVSDSLLGMAIFHNPFVLGLYILIAGVLIVVGIGRLRGKNP